jgi:hypothetical protein
LLDLPKPCRHCMWDPSLENLVWKNIHHTKNSCLPNTASLDVPLRSHGLLITKSILILWFDRNFSVTRLLIFFPET